MGDALRTQDSAISSLLTCELGKALEFAEKEVGYESSFVCAEVESLPSSEPRFPLRSGKRVVGRACRQHQGLIPS